MTKRIILPILCALGCLLTLMACLEEKDPLNYAPTVNTGQATDITYTGATLSGTIQRNANTIVAECGILISQSRDMTSYTELKANAVSSASFAVNATGLTPGTTYYYCAYASSGYSEVRGEVNHFITPEGTSPLFGNVEITTNDGRSATITATITDKGGSELVLCGVRYWEAENGEEDLETKGRLVTGTTGMTFNVTISDLMPSTEYILCAIAHNATSMGYSDKLHVTTSKAAPIVDTHEVTNISSLTATFNGRITSDGSTPITSRGFCYGTDANPAQNGSRMPVEGNATDFTLDVSGLSASTTYYVCAYAENEMGAAYGEVVSFTTEDRVPGIYSLEDLLAFRDAKNNNQDISAYKDAEGVIRLYTDIDLSSVSNWESISNLNTDETLEGNGHSITNLYCSGSEMSLIGANRGIIQNLTLAGTFESSQYASSGAFCLYNSGTMYNCHNYVDVIAHDECELHCGGLTNNNTGIIDNCTNHGNLNAAVTGGFVESNSGTISNCTNYGNINATMDGGGFVGGINDGTITDCVNEASVTVASDGGGIAARMQNGSIMNCENHGTIYGPTSGGIVGSVELTENKIEISGNLHTGAAEGPSNSNYHGGICGCVRLYYETGNGYLVYSNNINEGTVNGEPGTDANAIGSDERNQQ